MGCDFGDVVVRGSDVAGVEIDSPWLLEGDSSLLVNGVNVVSFVDAELNRRFPGRELSTVEDPEGSVSAWAALERTGAATIGRATAMPAGTMDDSVGGEWLLAETLRHLVTATDTWLGRASWSNRSRTTRSACPMTITTATHSTMAPSRPGRPRSRRSWRRAAAGSPWCPSGPPERAS